MCNLRSSKNKCRTSHIHIIDLSMVPHKNNDVFTADWSISKQFSTISVETFLRQSLILYSLESLWYTQLSLQHLRWDAISLVKAAEGSHPVIQSSPALYSRHSPTCLKDDVYQQIYWKTIFSIINIFLTIVNVNYTFIGSNCYCA